eukprot:6207196-Pleurochrysis_carterae.AAC.1
MGTHFVILAWGYLSSSVGGSRFCRSRVGTHAVICAFGCRHSCVVTHFITYAFRQPCTRGTKCSACVLAASIPTATTASTIGPFGIYLYARHRATLLNTRDTSEHALPKPACDRLYE